MYEFRVPDIGEGVVEAEVLEWRVREGDQIKEDELLVDLMTDKAEIEIPSPCAGRIHRLHAQVGDIVPVGAILLEIDDSAVAEGRLEEVSPPPERPRREEARPAEAAPRTRTEGAAAHPPPLPERPRSQQKASERAAAAGVDVVPAVRELARRRGVDLERVRGTGPGGRIMRRDVERAHAGESAAEPEAAPLFPPEQDAEDWERRPLRGLRRAIARRMSRARRTAAHFTYVDEVDMTRLLERAEAADITASPLAFIASATLRVLPDYELLNASIDDGRHEIIIKRALHLGIATATDDGLVVPVIRDAARLSVAELASAIRELATRARQGGLRPEELRGSSFTITSLGKLGGIMSTPIVNYPEVAILGVNAIREVPVLEQGELRARRVMNLSLSVDHRIADGLVAAEFVRDVREILEGADFPELSTGSQS